MLMPSALLVLSLAPAASSLMPIPRAQTTHQGRLPIDKGFGGAVSGACDARVNSALRRGLARLAAQTGFDLAPAASASATLTIACDAAGPAIPALEDDESYTLDVDGSRALLHARTSVGAVRGLETVLQLVDGDRAGFFLPALYIDDGPRFPWRGLLIDVSRHFMPVSVIERNLDGMASVKLNVLHLHLTDDQGFRVESRKYPTLHQLGSDGLFYTQDEIRRIVRYAADRGIRVIPEFDMPGHVTSWLAGHPEIASAPGPYEIGRRWGVFDPALDPTQEDTYKIVDGFVGEMAQLFPDAFMHIGGDENNGKQWAANVKIQAFMKQRGIADAHALQAYFNQRLSKILTKHGKQMVGWDEILHPDLPHSIVIQSWRGQKSLVDGAKQGYRGLLSNGYYLDLIHTTRDHYLADPLPADAGLDAEQARGILGGEACMWAEYVSPDTIDTRIWPRLAAIAERFWSPAAVRDVDDMYRRLDVMSVRLESLGLKHESEPGMMLRRLARELDPAPLETLAGVVEPVKDYRRGRMRAATQSMPLTRLVDAARPDSRASRKVAQLVDALLADSGHARGRDELARTFASWRDVRPSIDVLIDRSPALDEARPLAADLSDMGVLGLEALAYLSSGTPAPDGWKDRAVKRLDEAEKPKAELEFPFVASLRKLTDAAARLP